MIKITLKRFFISILFGLVIAFFIYFLFPVPYLSISTKACNYDLKKGGNFPPTTGCFNNCLGVFIKESCEENGCRVSCNGQCFGVVVGTCVDDKQSKNLINRFTQ